MIFQVYDIDCTLYPVPEKVNTLLNSMTTAKDVEEILREYESDIARVCPALVKLSGRNENLFLWCDCASELMSQVLKHKGIAHETVTGHCDEGSAHAWVRVDGVNYDSTDQGYGDGKYTVCFSYGGEDGSEEHHDTVRCDPMAEA